MSKGRVIKQCFWSPGSGCEWDGLRGGGGGRVFRIRNNKGNAFTYFGIALLMFRKMGGLRREEAI